jgi:hypothetical protein
VGEAKSLGGERVGDFMDTSITLLKSVYHYGSCDLFHWSVLGCLFAAYLFWMPNFTQIHKINKLFLLHIPRFFGGKFPQNFQKKLKDFHHISIQIYFVTIVLASFLLFR